MNDISLFEALQRGIAAHKIGNLQEADRCYTAILKLDPYHSDANHNMGVLAVGLNKIEAAIPFFKQAIQSDPSIPQFWISLVDALIKINRFNEGANLLVEAQKQKMSNETLLKLSALLETRFSSEDEVLKAQLSQINNLKEKI